MMPMKFGSVCSGIEAASVAWRPLGWEAAWLSEIEPFPCALLAHHYPDVPNLGDMTKFEDWPDDEKHSIDVLCGGTPCQSFSVAGLRKGLDDPRGDLMLTFGAIAAKYRPRWLVWENVPGVLSSNGGQDFASFLGLITGQEVKVPEGGWANSGLVSGIPDAYGVAFRVLDAQYFGVAQRRRRVFVVGCLGDWRSAAAVLFERHSLQGHPAPSRQAGKAAPTIPSRSTAGGGLGTDFDCDGGLVAGTLQASGKAAESATQQDAESGLLLAVPQAFGGNNTAGPIDVATALRAHGTFHYDFESETFLAHSLRGEGFDASEDGTGRGTPLVPVGVTIHGTAPAVQTVASYSDLAQCLLARTPGKIDNSSTTVVLQPVPVAFPANLSATQHASAENINPSLGALNPTAVAFNMHKSGNEASSLGISEDRTDCLRAFEKSPFAVQPSNGMMVRRLTPEECEALQGFPRSYTRIAWRNKPADQCPDGPRYKAIGNSWAVPCARWIGERIAEIHGRFDE